MRAAGGLPDSPDRGPPPAESARLAGPLRRFDPGMAKPPPRSRTVPRAEDARGPALPHRDRPLGPRTRPEL